MGLLISKKDQLLLQQMKESEELYNNLLPCKSVQRTPALFISLTNKQEGSRIWRHEVLEVAVMQMGQSMPKKLHGLHFSLESSYLRLLHSQEIHNEHLCQNTPLKITPNSKSFRT
jgi:hypothetical protein